MTTPRTYVIELEADDGEITFLRRKGVKDEEVLESINQEFPDHYIMHFSRAHIWEKIQKRLNTKAIFPRNPHRAGKFIYQHKGRKKRGRKNYPLPNGGWARRFRATFTWTETYSKSLTDFLKEWIAQSIKMSHEAGEVVALSLDIPDFVNDPDAVTKTIVSCLPKLPGRGLEVPAIVFDSLAMFEQGAEPKTVMVDPSTFPKLSDLEQQPLTPAEAAQQIRAAIANAPDFLVGGPMLQLQEQMDSRRPTLGDLRRLTGM